MSEYGKRLVEAVRDRVGDAFMDGVWTETEAKAALLAFLDKLIEEGASGGMLERGYYVLQTAGLKLAPDSEAIPLDDAWTAMLRALRTEIAEER